MTPTDGFLSYITSLVPNTFSVCIIDFCSAIISSWMWHMFPICYVWSLHRREGVTERTEDRDRRKPTDGGREEETGGGLRRLKKLEDKVEAGGGWSALQSCILRKGPEVNNVTVHLLCKATCEPYTLTQAPDWYRLLLLFAPCLISGLTRPPETCVGPGSLSLEDAHYLNKERLLTYFCREQKAISPRAWPKLEYSSCQVGSKEKQADESM